MKTFFLPRLAAVLLAGLVALPAAGQTEAIPPGRAAANASVSAAQAQAAASVRIDPTFWWVGMKNPKLQLLVHRPGIGTSTARLAPYPGVTLDESHKLESPNYLEGVRIWS